MFQAKEELPTTKELLKEELHVEIFVNTNIQTYKQARRLGS